MLNTRRNHPHENLAEEQCYAKKQQIRRSYNQNNTGKLEEQKGQNRWVIRKGKQERKRRGLGNKVEKISEDQTT